MKRFKAAHTLPLAAAITVVSAIAPLGLVTAGDAVAAPTKGATTAVTPANAPPSAGVNAMRRGIDAYKRGKHANAIGALSTAISNGGLASTDLARALYFRGLAYRKLGKPSQAIPDLTNAIWLGDGLEAAERSDAIANRAAAYRDAGLPDSGDVAGSATPSAPAATAAASSPSPAAATGNGWPAAETHREAPRTAGAPAAAEKSSPSGIGAIGGFFGNLFGGSSSSSAEQSGTKEITTASTAARSAGAAAVPSAVSSWSNATEVTQKTTAPTRVAAVTAAEPAAAAKHKAPAANGGKYKLQVAVVRSREEANRLIGAILAKHGAELKSYTTAAEETVLGNMGTFFRVNVAPFADTAAPQRLCKSLVADGYDCMVVSN